MLFAVFFDNNADVNMQFLMRVGLCRLLSVDRRGAPAKKMIHAVENAIKNTKGDE